MKPMLRILSLVPAAALLAAVPTSATAVDNVPVTAQVNAYRRSLGKPALQRHAGLDRLARRHAEFMRRNRGKFGKGGAGNLTHYGFEDRTLMAQRGMGMSDVGENVGSCRGVANAADVLVGAWKKSRGHQLNLKGIWTRTGVGVAVDSDGTVFATQLFGTESRSHFSLTDRMRRF